MKQEDKLPGDPILAAIRDVLLAERSAEATLASAHERAEVVRHTALERVQIISGRVRGRITRMQQSYLAEIDEEIAALPPAVIDVSAAAPPDIVAAVRAVARQLTSDVDGVAK